MRERNLYPNTPANSHLYPKNPTLGNKVHFALRRLFGYGDIVLCDDLETYKGVLEKLKEAGYVVKTNKKRLILSLVNRKAVVSDYGISYFTMLNKAIKKHRKDNP